MSVFRLIQRLPGPAVVRDRSRAMAMLDAVLTPDPLVRTFFYRADWAPGAELASMRDGCGNGYTVGFDAAGAFAYGFDRESPISAGRPPGAGLWPGLLDGLPDGMRHWLPQQPQAAAALSEITLCFWQQAGDTDWRIGRVELPAAVGYGEDVDGAEWLFAQLADPTPAAYRQYAEEYFEVSPDLDAVRHVYALQPLTERVVRALNPDLELAGLADDIARIGYPVWARTARRVPRSEAS